MARFISPLGRTPDTKELSSSTDFTVDATTDIVLDADGGDILFKDGGTTIGEFTNSSSDLVIKSSVSDKDILVKGNDGGSAITAITLDMSAAGKATFNNEIVSGAVITSGAGLVIADGGNIGSASDTDAIAIAANGVVTFSQAPVFPDGSIDIADIDLDGGTDIGASIADADLFLIDDGAGGTMRKTAASRLKTYINASAAGSVNADDIAGGDAAVTLTTTTGDITIDAAANDSDIILKGTDGGSDTTFLTIDGSAAGKATFNNEIVSGAVITSGAGLVIADAGTIGSASDTDAIAIASNGAVTFSQAVSGTSADFDGGVTIDNITIDGTEIDLSSGDLTIDSAGKIILDADGSDAFVEFHDSGTVYGRINQSSNNMHIRSMINSADVIIQGFDSGGSLVNSAQFDMSDSGALLLHNNIKMASDGAILKMGVGNDVTLTHVHDSGLTLTNRTTSDDSPVVFQLKSSEGIITANEVIASIEMAAGDVSGTDASTVAAGIHAIAEGAFTSSANPTKLVFTTGVSETAAASATAKMTLSSAGLLTIADDFVIKDGGTIGSASDTDAIAIAADGVVTMNQIPVFSAGINVSGGNIAGTLSTAAQTNITSVGTLTALTVDDVAVNGKVITMTGSTDDTAVFTVGTNGTLTIETTDTAAAAANIQVTADGTFEVDATTITLDSAGDIVLDADGANVTFKDAGTAIGDFSNSSSDFVITASVQDKDIIFKGDDGGSAITALTLDMSAAGAATFNSSVTSGAGLIIADGGNIGSASDTDAIAIASDGIVTFSQKVVIDGGIDVDNFHFDGATIALSSGDMVLDGAGDIILDADGADIIFKDGGTAIGTFTNSSSDFVIAASVQDKDILFKGDDGGSAITALTLDMSAAGAATFNAGVTSGAGLLIADDGTIGSASDTDAITIAANGNTTFSQDVTVSGNLTVSGTTTQVNTVTMNAENAVVFEGATADSHETTLTIIDPTADRTQRLINQSGFIPLLEATTTTVITSTPAELNLLDGSSANSVVNSKAVIYGSSGELAGELSTAAQPNVTSLGTLSALTVDDVAINGKVITMTGSSSDTAVFTVGTNGTLSIVTTDDSAAAANIQITADGTFEVDATTITLDSGGDIVLDADGADVIFKDGGTSILTFTNSSSDAVITSGVQDKDIIFKGDDGGSAITALTLDMSAAGAATFNDAVTSGAVITSGAGLVIADGGNIGSASDTDAIAIASDGVVTFSQKVVIDGGIDVDNFHFDGATIALSSGDMVLDSAGDIILDADGADVIFKDGGTAIGSFTNSSSDFVITSSVQDKDIIFKGDDGGSAITALTLDMSAAGAATFNGAITGGGLLTTGGNIVIPDDGNIGSASDTDAIAIAANGAVTFSQAVSGTSADFDGGITIDNISIDGTEIDLSSGDLTLDVAGDIILNAAGGDIFLEYGATRIAEINLSTSDLRFETKVSNADIRFQGLDSSSAITALQLDMSAGGKAIFNAGGSFAAAVTNSSYFWLNTDDITGLFFGASAEISVTHDHNTGLTFKNSNSADNNPFVLQLKSEENEIVADEVIASIEMAAGDSSGTDASTVAAGIHAIAEGEFTSTANPTKLVFTTGTDGSASRADTPKMTLSSAGLLTIADDFVIKDGGTIGSASDTDAIAIASDGVVTMNQIPVFSAGINVSGGNIAGTLSTAAQTNITSVGTLTALTVDDVAINGKVITMTGSSSDTAVFTVGTNGTLSIVTTDDSAAAANIQITADGTAELAGTTVTLDSGGDIVLDADGADVIFKDGGTTILSFTNSSSDAVITSGVQDKDIIFKGDDGGSAITALTLDMSAAGAATFNGAITGGGLLTTGGNIVIPDAGNIGSASDTDAIAIASDGVVTFSQAPVFPDGSINIADIDLDGGTDIGAAIVDADLFLIDDGAGGTMRKTAASRLKTYIGAGALDDITAGDSAVTLATTSGNITIDAQANNSDIILKGTDGGSDTTFLTIDGSAAGKATFNDEIVSGAVITSGAGLVIADAGNIGSASDTDAIAIAANGTVTFSQAVSGTSADFDGGVTIDNITIDGTEIDLSSGDLTLDVAGDIILNADGADIKLADASVTFGHLSNSSSDFVIEAKVQDKDIIFKGDDGGSGITALTLDMSAAGAATFNGAITGGGLLTTGGNIVIPDDGNIGSASDTDSIAIAADGVVTMNQIPVFSAGINVSGGSIAGTLSTAAQTNITSVGTLTALTVDDVAINGKVITMTGSSSDTAVFTAGTNGTLSIVTTDAAAAAANITITADGTFEADGTTITLDSGGDIVLDADGADVIFKDAGTTILSFTNSSSDAVITSGVQDKDIIFKGDDGGSAITALTLDMSAAGAASFNSTITCTPTATLLIKNSSGSTLKTIHGVNSS